MREAFLGEGHPASSALGEPILRLLPGVRRIVNQAYCTTRMHFVVRILLVVAYRAKSG